MAAISSNFRVQKALDWGTSKGMIATLAVTWIALSILGALALAGPAYPGSALGVLGTALGGNIGGAFLITNGFLVLCLSAVLGRIHILRQKARLGGHSPNNLTPAKRAGSAALARAQEARVSHHNFD